MWTRLLVGKKGMGGVTSGYWFCFYYGPEENVNEQQLATE